MRIRLLHLLFYIYWGSALITPEIVFAQIYSDTNVDGAIVLSNFPAAEASELLVPVPSSVKEKSKSIAALAIRASRIPSALKKMIEEVAHEYHLDPQLLHAVIKVESGYDPRALSPKGARGLMQLMPDTARRFGASDAFDPRENVQAGARYLVWLLDLFKGDIALALAGYNAGEQAVIRAGYRLPDYPETRNYVPKVLRQYQPPPPR